MTFTRRGPRSRRQARGPPPARLQAAGQRDRRHRRGRRGGQARHAPVRAASATATTGSRLPAPIVVDAPDIEAVVARMARIPARQASSSDRERLRTLEESLERVVFGQTEAVHLVAQAIKRSRAGLGAAGSAGGLLPVHGSHRRRQDGTRQAARDAAGQRVHPLRHERVHGEARGGAADRRAARIRRIRAGRPAGGRRAHASLQRWCCSTKSKRRIRTSSTSCCR